MASGAALIASVRRDLRAAGNPDRAAGQQRYMKSAMPYHGITTPQLRAVLRPHLRSFTPSSRQEWEGTVRTLWDEATHREQRYAAIALARHRRAQEWRDTDSFDLWRHLVVTGAWWDYIDEIAANLVGEVLADHRQAATPVIRAWATEEDVWLRRTAVLSQLKHKGDTDTTLLADTIEANASEESFWLRKAIGWALREYAKTDPEWVRTFVAARDLSPLSRREALKHLESA